MNFDYGNVFGQSWRITWKYKVLWGLTLLPMLLSFLSLPFFFAPVFFLEENTSDTAGTVFLIVIFAFIIIFSVVSFLLNSICMSSATLGVIRADRGEGSLSFFDLLKDSTPYFGRILGVTLIIGLSIGLLFSIFFTLVFVLSIVTMGLASICLQPVMILLTPLMFLMIAVMESAQTAAIAENIGVVEALKRALQIVGAHVWKYILITLVIYFGSSFLTSFIMFPLMVPLFAVPFFIDSNTGLSPETMVVVFIAFSCIFFPVMLAIQGIVGAFMKVSLDVTYLRLSRPAEDQVVFQQEKA